MRRALDFVRSDGGATAGCPVLASAAGTATRHSQPSGAGNYISVDHGGGWTTYYFHLNAFSVPSGAFVAQGQQIGTTGSTGNSSGAHIHYEQLLNGVGQNIVIDGAALPYPGSYHQAHLTSTNGCGGGGGTPFNTWGSGVNVRADARLNAPVVTTLAARRRCAWSARSRATPSTPRATPTTGGANCATRTASSATSTSAIRTRSSRASPPAEPHAARQRRRALSRAARRVRWSRSARPDALWAASA
ncbi:M23 family metallopeptidase [Actinomadura keratinilytica]